MFATYPTRLKKDGILEALVEVRFHTDELPEVILGRLSDNPTLKGLDRTRTPIADIPAPIRESDPSLKYSPVFEYKNDGPTEMYKFNHHMFSFHNVSEYQGWDAFKLKVNELISLLFERFDDVSVNRVGLRYINCLNPEHSISSINDLKIGVEVSGSALAGNFNLNYLDNSDDKVESLIRVASPNFIDGKLPDDAVAFCDFDVFTPKGTKLSSLKECMEWLEIAHNKEKQLFFDMLPNSVIESLREE